MSDGKTTCNDCALDLVRFVRDYRAPRFNLRAGDEWKIPRKRIHDDGSFELAGGTVRAEDYELAERGASYVCGRTCSCRGGADG